MNTLITALEARSIQLTGHGFVKWNTTSGKLAEAPAGPRLLSEQLYNATPMRVGNHYPRQLNYHGWYAFSQTGKHVWHESRLEARSLMFLDMHTDVVAIASQPMRMDFADGTTHYPDYLALHGNGRQMVYDVKPAERLTDKALEQFARTQALCRRVGWGYQVITGLNDQERENVTYLSHFKNAGFQPDDAAVRRLSEWLDRPSTFLDAARALQLATLPQARSALLHLLWTRSVVTDISIRLTDLSMIERNPNAHG